jgi:O-6-methylguanine DNA methyltransferase
MYYCYLFQEDVMHYYDRIDTTVGTFWAACNNVGITMISLAHGSSKTFETAYFKRFGVQPIHSRIPESYASALRKAAEGREPGPVPFDLSGLSEFQKKVLRILQKTPRGQVRTYKELAVLAGRPKAARAVGNTMACNPVPLLIPCHRVVPSTGGIGNYGLGVELKRELLMREGVLVDTL